MSSAMSKWPGFGTAVWVVSICGYNYTYSNYSDALKTPMNLTQLKLNNLIVAKDVGSALGLLAGYFSDRLPTPVILIIGSIEGLIGYGAQWLVVSKRIQPLPYWQMCVFLCMGENSTMWMNTTVLLTCLRNFGWRNDSLVSCILKSYAGLSTAILTNICTTLFAGDPSKFLFMLAVDPFVICLPAVFFLREIPPATTVAEKVEETMYFTVFKAIAILLAVYLLGRDFVKTTGDAVSVAFAVVLLVLLASPLLIPFYSYLMTRNSTRLNPDVEGQIDETLLNPEQAAVNTTAATTEDTVAPPDEAEEMKRRPVIGEDLTIYEAMRTVDFWILFSSFLCGVGTGMTVMNNIGQMALALGYVNVTTLVSLMSIFGFFGQFISGSLSDYFLEKAGTPRPLWNAASQILMAVGYMLLALDVPGSLYIGSILLGLCYGVRLAVLTPIAELFGEKNYGLIYNILILNIPLGSFLFSGLLTGYLYDTQATPIAGGGNTCVGAHCYRLVFTIMAIVCLVGFGLDIVLAFKTKHIYALRKSSSAEDLTANEYATA
ncbi:hypothetical protein LWI29_033910 [Acer saccharum]|uniref:Nodulin-like domain-containing protein n=1 Tax=Acer saccharum TaxID=4024 RepID=A0AA39VEH0_ACESA|nr:hypothetical protein LWI29_033910 [Acer saccharum]